MQPVSISAIIPTIGRPAYLRLCLETLLAQTVKVDEVIIIDASSDSATHDIVSDNAWELKGLNCRYFRYSQPNAAAQRNFGVEQSSGEWLLFLDDDVELTETWVEEMLRPMRDDLSVAATLGAISNQPYAVPTPIWCLYYRLIAGHKPEEAQGMVVGAAVISGFTSGCDVSRPIEWLGGGASAIRRSVFNHVGGFAPYFTGPSPGEDIDLGYRISRKWHILFVPSAKLYHHAAAAGRVNLTWHQYYSMRSRYAIQRRAIGRGYLLSLYHTAMWAVFQSTSELLALRKRLSLRFLAAWWGRLLGFASCIFWNPPASTGLPTRSS
jgi:GT2 family glycosyltransferase